MKWFTAFILAVVTAFMIFAGVLVLSAIWSGSPAAAITLVAVIIVLTIAFKLWGDKG